MKAINVLVKNKEQFLELRDIANFKSVIPDDRFFDEVEEKGGLWIRLINKGNGVCTRDFFAWGKDIQPDSEKGYYKLEDITC